jgi:peptide/nickel transport system substrate-binding protein
VSIRRVVAGVLAALLTATLLPACVKRPAPRSSDDLVVAVSAEPQSLDPLLLEGPTDLMVGSLIFSYLLADGPNGQPVPDVARAVPTLANGGISPDGLRIIYHLRRDVHWQDGVRLTARDCVFTYRAIVNPNNAIPSRYGYDDIVSVTAPDDYTLVVKLARPVRSTVDGFLAADGNYAIMPEHLLAEYPSINRIDYNAHPIGSGPYRVVEWVRGDHLLLQANPTYFRGAPSIKELRIDFISDSSTMLNELRTGEIGAAFDLDPALNVQARAIPTVRVVLTPISGMGVFVMNTQREPTSDLRVREAIASALNGAVIVDKASHGAFLARNGRRAILLLPTRSSVATPSYDPARARALLDAAGWRVGADGFRRKHGRRLSLTLTTSADEPMTNVVTVMAQAQLLGVGIDVAIHSYGPTIYKAPAAAGGPIFGGHFSLAYLLITTGSDGDLSFLYDCSQRPPLGFDISRICDSRVDAAARTGAQALDPQIVREDNARLESLLEADVPEVVLYQPQRVSAFTTRLRGFTQSPVSPFTNAWKWTLH